MAHTYPIIRMIINNEYVEFQDSDILECTILQESHPISIELPISTADVTVYTNDNRFSVYSDGVFYNALSKNLPVEIYEQVEEATQFIGKFYLDKWGAESENTLRFELVDAIGICANTEYPGSFWETDTPFSDIVADVMVNNAIPYAIDIEVRSRQIKGWIPPGTVREALQQLCFAARVRASTDGSYGIAFKDASLPIQNPMMPYVHITDAEKTSAQIVDHLPLVTDISVISHDYYNLGDVAQTVEEIYSAWLEPGTYIIAYQKPYWRVWGEGVGSVPIFVTTEDGRVMTTEDSGNTWETARIATELETFQFHSNYVSVRVETAGQITIWGYPWLSSERPHAYAVQTDAEKNVISVDNAMLIGTDNVLQVLSKLVDYYQLRYRKSVTLFPYRLVLGNLYTVDSLRDKRLIGVASKAKSDLTGGYLINAEFLGMEKIEE